MSFLKPIRMTKKRFKFQVTLHLEELCSVPFVTGTLYCKVRLRDGGSFTDNTKRSDVQEHTVAWKSKFQFQCKMSADPSSGVLEPCTLRISVRKEVKGGKSSAKVGLVDLNLAEFAGSNHTPRHCLLEAYQDKNRLDNSLLKIIVGMHLLSGDPCFKIPTVRDTPLPLPEDHRERGEGSESSGFGSLPRKIPKGHITRNPDPFEPGHSRNASSTSQHSKLSDYGSKHSRTPSSTSQASSPGGSQPSSDQGLSSSPTKSYRSNQQMLESRHPAKMAPPPRPPPPNNALCRPLDVTQEDRMGVTRVSADDIVNKIMADQDFTHNASADEEEGLRLYVSSDGTTALGGQSFYNRGGTSMFQPVLIDHDVRPNSRNISNDSSSR